MSPRVCCGRGICELSILLLGGLLRRETPFAGLYSARVEEGSIRGGPLWKMLSCEVDRATPSGGGLALAPKEVGGGGMIPPYAMPPFMPFGARYVGGGGMEADVCSEVGGGG